MRNLKITTAQFEVKSGNKEYNISMIETLCKEAAKEKSQVIVFPECSITGYSFLRKLDKKSLEDIAENLPDGESIKSLIEISKKTNIIILSGLIEKDKNGKIFNTYVCIGQNGLITKYRKLHPFINSHLSRGSEYCVFDLFGWKCGILVCYDNNIIENVRATKLLGADLIFMPHVTMCTPSTRPGAGFVEPKLWDNRLEDPTSLRLEFNGMKGREWLMKWLPARAYDNGIYVAFSNLIGMDDDQLKNGCSMILDPFGDILCECTMLGDGTATAALLYNKIEKSGGHRYLNARRPDLYGEIITQDHQSDQKVTWLTEKN